MQNAASLLLRLQRKDARILLMKGLSLDEGLKLSYGDVTLTTTSAVGGIIYSYDAEKKTLSETGESVWNSAEGDIGGSVPGFEPSNFDLLLQPHDNLLTYKAGVVTTAGKTFLRRCVSPRGDLLAVLSAAGERSKSPMPFLGQGGASGQHYHQIFRLPGMTPFGNPVPLAFTSEQNQYRAVWSPDQRFVVYTNSGMGEISIVEVVVPEGPRP